MGKTLKQDAIASLKKQSCKDVFIPYFSGRTTVAIFCGLKIRLRMVVLDVFFHYPWEIQLNFEFVDRSMSLVLKAKKVFFYQKF